VKNLLSFLKFVNLNIKKIFLGDIIDTLYDVFTSFISDNMSNFNSDFYYQNDSYMTMCYLEEKILD